MTGDTGGERTATLEALRRARGDEARRLADIVGDTAVSGWSRTVESNRGKDGLYAFTVAGRACRVVHEVHRQLLDANGTLHPRPGA
jgi:hypothetical protein